MTREEVLALNLLREEKARVEGFYLSYDRFKWHEEKDKFANCTTVEQVKTVCSDLQAAYDKRKELEAKAHAKHLEYIDKRNKLDKLIKDAGKYGLSIDDIIEIVTNTYKERHNAKINAKIAEINAKINAKIEALQADLIQ